VNSLSAGLSSFDVSGMATVVRSLVTDADTATEVVYHTNGGGRAYDPATGQASYGDTATTLSGWLSPLSLEQVAKVDGAQVGDVQLLIAFDDLATPPTTADRFTVGTAGHNVYAVTDGPLDTHWCVFAHRAP
jgi:hypothetical protein